MCVCLFVCLFVCPQSTRYWKLVPCIFSKQITWSPSTFTDLGSTRYGLTWPNTPTPTLSFLVTHKHLSVGAPYTCYLACNTRSMYISWWNISRLPLSRCWRGDVPRFNTRCDMKQLCLSRFSLRSAREIRGIQFVSITAFILDYFDRWSQTARHFLASSARRKLRHPLNLPSSGSIVSSETGWCGTNDSSVHTYTHARTHARTHTHTHK